MTVTTPTSGPDFAGWVVTWSFEDCLLRSDIAPVQHAGRDILILDEPTSGLDYRHMTQVADALHAMSAEGKSVFVITHDIELVLRCCTHAIYLTDGEVAHTEPLDHTGTQQLRAFFE